MTEERKQQIQRRRTNVPPSTDTRLDALNKDEQEFIKQKEAEETINNWLKRTTQNILFKIAQIIIILGFGLLFLIGVGALIFYVLDYASDFLGFPFGDYTDYVMGIVALFNFCAACFGCFATYRFGTIQEETERLSEIGKRFGRDVRTIEKLDKNLKTTLDDLQIKINHLVVENRELRDNLKSFKDPKISEDLKREQSDLRRQQFLVIELYENYKKEVRFRLAMKVSTLTTIYFEKAYQDGNLEDGLDKSEFASLLLIGVPARERKYFGKFDHPAWKKSINGTILVDAFEKTVYGIYDKILIHNTLATEQIVEEMKNDRDEDEQLIAEEKAKEAKKGGLLGGLQRIFG